MLDEYSYEIDTISQLSLILDQPPTYYFEEAAYWELDNDAYIQFDSAHHSVLVDYGPTHDIGMGARILLMIHGLGALQGLEIIIHNDNPWDDDPDTEVAVYPKPTKKKKKKEEKSTSTVIQLDDFRKK